MIISGATRRGDRACVEGRMLTGGASGGMGGRVDGRVRGVFGCACRRWNRVGYSRQRGSSGSMEVIEAAAQSLIIGSVIPRTELVSISPMPIKRLTPQLVS